MKGLGWSWLFQFCGTSALPHSTANIVYRFPGSSLPWTHLKFVHGWGVGTVAQQLILHLQVLASVWALILFLAVPLLIQFPACGLGKQWPRSLDFALRWEMHMKLLVTDFGSPQLLPL